MSPDQDWHKIASSRIPRNTELSIRHSEKTLSRTMLEEFVCCIGKEFSSGNEVLALAASLMMARTGILENTDDDPAQSLAVDIASWETGEIQRFGLSFRFEPVSSQRRLLMPSPGYVSIGR